MFPRIARVRQCVTQDRIPDVTAHVRAALQALPLADHLQPGMSVAVGVGSRGIGCIGDVVRTLLAEIRQVGADPFLIPAMGSHGGGTAQGQRAVLEGYGLGEDQTGVPIRSSMEVVEVGVTPRGMPVHWDAHAAQADAVFVVNRVKPHTAFRAPWESGLFKMLAVGLGKERGAATLHGWGIVDAIPDAARLIVERMPVVAGVAIVENGRHEPAAIEVVPAAEIEAREPQLLELAWRHMPRLPFEPLDLLVLREIGKDISGTGMDLNLVGMWRRKGGPVDPDVRVLAVLDLTEGSHGNAIGIGYADLVPRRLVEKMDPAATYTNCLTSGNYNGGKVPVTLATDREVIAAGLPAVEPEAARLVILRNTLEVETLWVSEALLPMVEESPDLEQCGSLQPIPFDQTGALHLPLQPCS